ncbi:serine protease [Mycolicibacterium sp. CH28]|uniref:trypsin-like serine peptidase n=1 Tax=Mycolicibacterium sp. CH28 TaxID=2512237 RepID=UPI00108128E1|nr:trypsin-like peptidase domain-containing protein [Mycolicibacterium sp. CH28]TGD86484.1 serine protease [Mycolicibacterium sp. CH28]
MRTVATALGLAAATTLVAGCQQSAGPPKAAAAAVAVTILARPTAPMPSVGAIFLGGTDTHTCTASVVHSASQDLILTAAHCLAAEYPATFVPGFDDKADPADVWTVDAVYLDPRWVASQDPTADYAFARVSRPAGGAIEAVTGEALTLGTAPAPADEIMIVGYPTGVGGAPIGCDTVSTMDPGGYPSLHCGGLVDGTSGAPWIKGTSVLGAIGGHEGGGCQDSISYSSRFDGATAALLARAEAGGPGDQAPDTFNSGC